MDIHLKYTEKGSGEALVLLHGNNDSGAYFSKQLDAFSSLYRVIAVDTRGHGSSPRGTAPFTLSQFVEDLNFFLDELGIESANLLGFSDGGNIALMFAIKYPQRVKKLILNGANLTPSGVKAAYQTAIEAEYFILDRVFSRSERLKRRREMLSLMVNEPNITAEQLASLSVPTLIIVGTDDMIKVSETAAIHSGIKGSELKIIKGSHFVSREHPEEFNAAVLDFLGR